MTLRRVAGGKRLGLAGAGGRGHTGLPDVASRLNTALLLPSLFSSLFLCVPCLLFFVFLSSIIADSRGRCWSVVRPEVLLRGRNAASSLRRRTSFGAAPSRENFTANGFLLPLLIFKSETTLKFEDKEEDLVTRSRRRSFMPVANMTMESIQCTVRGCSCDCFSPGKTRLRICDSCEHGWVVHAMDKMAYRTPAHQVSGQSVEVVQPNIVFDIASLMLYGAQATPIRLKILLDRLFSVVQHDEVVQVLHSFGWSYEDYARGYILHDSSGRVLDKWSMATYEEEQLILQQFMRFGETKAIAQELIARDGWDQSRQGGVHCLLGSRAESDIKKFIERSNVGMQSFIKGYDAAQQLLSRTFMYPHLAATTGFARLLTPTILHNLQPPAAVPAAVAVTSRDKPGLSSPATPSAIINPLSRSPLRSLQTMEPFDYRKESIANSPKTSLPVASMDGASPKIEGRALLNLAIPGQAPTIPASLSTGPHLMMVKTEIPEEKSNKVTANDPKQPREPASTDGAINYSIKDLRVASSASLVFPSPSSSVSQASIAAAAAAAAVAAAATNPSSSIFAHQKLKHLRKSSNPMKRPWQPTPGYGGTLISPSGKKRVLCTACHKTFCDKGALKIHYSAVHLKEMHRCTVDGCTMMFSSRRSRNRHSANPNPKLHMPQTVRRKLPDSLISSNQDGDDDDDDDNAYTSHPLSMSQDEGSGSGVLVGSKGFAQRPNPVVLDALSDSSEADSTITDTLVRPVATYPLGVGPRFFLNPVLPAVPLQSQALVDSVRVIQSLCNSNTIGQPTTGQTMPEDMKVNEETKEVQDTATEVGTGRSSSKRKSAVPTRCSLQTDETDSDDISGDDCPTEKRACRTCSHQETPDLLNNTEMIFQKGVAQIKRDLPNAMEVADSNSTDQPTAAAPGVVQPDKNICSSSAADVASGRFSPNHKNEEMNGQVPRASTPSSTGVSAFPIDAPLSLTSQSNTVSENLTLVYSTDYEEPDHLAKDKARQDRCDANDSGVADLLKTSSDEPEAESECRTCSNIFQAHFGVSPIASPEPAHTKCHHTCIVKGCNATFPSKRSRDRHSANFNLHRRLLSTVTQLALPPSSSSSSPPPPSPEEAGKMSTDALTCGVSSSGIALSAGDECRLQGGNDSDTESLCTVLNLSKNVPVTESLDQRSSTDPIDVSPGLTIICPPTQEPEKRSSLPSPNQTNSTTAQVLNSMEVDDSRSVDSPVPPSSDTSGSVACHICQDPFKDNLALKEHQEHAHPKEMYRCTISGCDKIFSTRKSRNRHSQNENLHKHLLVTTVLPQPSSSSSSSLSSATSARQLAL